MRKPPALSLRYRSLKDLISSRLMLLAAVFSALLVLLMALGLLQKSWPILQSVSLGQLLFSTAWRPLSGEFGLATFIIGTLWVTAVAMVIAVPLSLLTAIYLAEYAPLKVRSVLKPVLDMLAAIPSVVYGVFGLLVIVPLSGRMAAFFGIASSGYNVLSGGVVLAIMVLPVIISISDEVIRTVPHGMREAAMALGSTRWEATKMVVGRGALPGIIAAVILGFSRAFGETMAVLMVVGNVFTRLPTSVFDPAYPLTALIANNYGEMMSIPLYGSALLLAALVLLLIVFAFSLAARIILVRLERRYSLA